LLVQIKLVVFPGQETARSVWQSVAHDEKDKVKQNENKHCDAQPVVG